MHGVLNHRFTVYVLIGHVSRLIKLSDKKCSMLCYRNVDVYLLRVFLEMESI